MTPKKPKRSHHTTKKKVVIFLAGMTGCGKSTVAKQLAEKYGLRHVSGGSALKELAIEAGYKPKKTGWWESAEGKRFMKQRVKDPAFDKKVDEKQLQWARRGNIIFDSWTMPWLYNGGFKIWLEASPSVRARRLARRNATSQREALKAIREKDAQTRVIYKNLYGFDLGVDFSPFDLILDTNDLNADEVLKTLCLVVDRLVLAKPSEKC